MERLTHRIKLAINQGQWKPIKIGRRCPELSHLLFVDDIILFAEVSFNQVEVIQRVLDDFLGWLGLKVSLGKSLLCVSANVKPNFTQILSNSLGISLTNNLGKYLRSPTIHGRVTQNTYKFILDKVYSKLARWKAKYVSLAGKVTLIKSVTSAIPVYAM